MGYIPVMQVVAETPIFSRQTERLFSEDEKRELIDFLAENPLAGDEIPGTGGVRKVRFAASGRGKRGGARVIYYYLDETMPLYALLAYAKNAKTDMTPDEKRAVSALVVALKATRKQLK
jgi:mRNA-degrading endonuclease RelE of RelBE toxin-antitoxin system